jgi:hypothetical protein
MGPMLWFFYFAEKFGEKMAFLTQPKGNFAEKVIITMVFEKSAIFC